MAEEANDGQNGQPEGGGKPAEPTDWEAKYMATVRQIYLSNVSRLRVGRP